jgi:hypothetical protein
VKVLITKRQSSLMGENKFVINLVPRACDPREGTRGSGIIRCQKPGILAKIELRIHFNGQSDSSLKQIIPEPRVPSRGSQARGTRLICHSHLGNLVPRIFLWEPGYEVAIWAGVSSFPARQLNACYAG